MSPRTRGYFLDAQALEAASADGAWSTRLEAVRGLLLSARADAGAAAPLLQSALDGFERTPAPDGRLHDSARQALARP